MMHRSDRAVALAFWILMAGAASLGSGCVVHGHGGYAQVDLVDVQGYHHTGYYDDHHNWHGGYYDEHHAWHDDAQDWHH
jgi:hypothetical protein